MAKFRKKPVEIDAILNDGEWDTIINWLNELAGGNFTIPFGSKPPIRRKPDGTLMIDTLEGTMKAQVGDWVIRGVGGKFYPCKPDIFEMTYDPFEE